MRSLDPSVKVPKRTKKPKAIRRIKKKVGDVIEIPTKKGLVYVQFTYHWAHPPRMGSFIRGLEGFYKKRLTEDELCEIVKKPHWFQTFCPVHATVNIGDWERVGNFPVPEFAQKLPIFKSSMSLFNRESPDERKWSLYDEETGECLGIRKLSKEERQKYPSMGGYNDTGLVIAIENGSICDL